MDIFLKPVFEMLLGGDGTEHLLDATVWHWGTWPWANWNLKAAGEQGICEDQCLPSAPAFRWPCPVVLPFSSEKHLLLTCGFCPHKTWTTQITCAYPGRVLSTPWLCFCSSYAHGPILSVFHILQGGTWTGLTLSRHRVSHSQPSRDHYMTTLAKGTFSFF